MNIKKAKLIGMLVGVVLFIVLIAGATYAWFTWASDTTNVGGSTTFFDVDYTSGSAINSTNFTPSTDKTNGLSTEVVIKKKANSIGGKATLTLNITSLTQSSSSISTYGAIDFSAIKWEVYKSTNSISPYTYNATPSYTGTLIGKGTTTGTTLNLFTNEELGNDNVSYKVYIWLDGTLADNSYIGTSLVSYISASAVQNS